MTQILDGKVVHTDYDSFDVPPAPYKPGQIILAENLLASKGKITSYFFLLAKELTEVAPLYHADAMRLLDATELRLVQTVTNLERSSAMLRKNNPKAFKPSDLYRKYGAALKAIMLRGGTNAFDARDTYTSLYLDQTLPDNELETPSYLDSYTGAEVDVDDVNIKVPDFSKIQVEANVTAADLGWDQKVFNQFIAAQNGGYTEEETSVPDDDRGYVPPTLTQDFTIVQWLQAESWKYASSFREAKGWVARKMQAHVAKLKRLINLCGAEALIPETPENQISIAASLRNMNQYKKELKQYQANWQVEFMSQLREQPEFKEVVDCIQRIAEEDVVTAAAVYVKVAGDYGLDHADIRKIRVHEDAYSTLVAFLDMYEDDIMELVHDSVSTPMSEEQALGEFGHLLDKGTDAQLHRVMPRTDVDPTKTSSWNIGYVNAMNDNATMDEAQGAAWEAWRQDMSTPGAAAYTRVMHETSNRKAAMTAFWGFCDNKKVPRQRDGIAKICADMKGLILTSGRTVSWAVACLKFKGNELELPDDIKARLVKKLTELGVGVQFAALLK